MASRLHGCSIVRDTRSLPWKIGNGDDVVLGVWRGAELKAVVACRQKGDRQWLVTDVIFADTEESLRAALAAAINLGSDRSDAADRDKPILKVAVLATAVMEPVLKEFGFYRDKYDFPLVIQILSPELSVESVDPSRWFVSAND